MTNKNRSRIDLPTFEQVEAERNKIKHKKAYNRAFLSTIYTLIIVASIAVLIATLVLPVLQISGTSMEPTLDDQDIVVLMKQNKLKQGDLCAFSYQNKVLIKRIIATPGDYVNIKDDGTVYVNNKRLDEPYVTKKSLGECDIEFPYQVPEKKYFVMGDHRETSIDSRSSVIGCVEKDQIIGKVFIKIWPIKKISIIH